MLKRIGSLVGAAIVAGTLGCATIISGANEEIKFHSEPDSARVVIDNVAVGHTPLVQKLRRKDKHTVRFELDGYAPTEIQLKRGVNGWVFGNIVLGGLIGVAIDAITGAMYSLSPDDVRGELSRNGAITGVTKDGLYVIMVLQPEPEWKRIGAMQPVRR